MTNKKEHNLKTFKEDLASGRDSDDVCAEHRAAQIKKLKAMSNEENRNKL